MARPRKPALLKQGKSESKTDLAERAEEEQKLKGNADKLANVPESLDDVGKEYYKFLVSELEISDLLCNLDVPILEQTADCLSKLKRAQEILNEEDIMIVTQDRYGNPKKQEHPMVHAKNVYLSQFRALCTQLGLSPASRAQLAGAKMQKKEEDEDPVMQLVKQAKK